MTTAQFAQLELARVVKRIREAEEHLRSLATTPYLTQDIDAAMLLASQDHLIALEHERVKIQDSLNARYR